MQKHVFLNGNLNNRQHTVRKLHFFSICPSEHQRRQRKFRNRYRMDNSNGFHNSFNTTLVNHRGQNQRTNGYSRNGDKTNRNPFDFTNKNNSSSQNTSLNNSNRNKNHNSSLKIAEITADNAAKSLYDYNKNNKQMVNTTKMAATTDKTGTSITDKHVVCQIHLLLSLSGNFQ